MEEQGNEARDLQWMLAAGEQLRAARRVLGNSYAFAFIFFGQERFAEGATEQEVALRQTLFEDQQQSLENEVSREGGEGACFWAFQGGWESEGWRGGWTAWVGAEERCHAHGQQTPSAQHGQHTPPAQHGQHTLPAQHG